MDTNKQTIGFIIMRCQGFHLGHKALLAEAIRYLNKIDTFTVKRPWLQIWIGSSQESGTMKNPFNASYRREKMLIPVLDNLLDHDSHLVSPTNRIVIDYLPDIGAGDTTDWGDYVLKNVLREFDDKNPDKYNIVAFSGEENVRKSWYAPGTVKEVYLPKIKGRGENFSATRCRQLLLDNCESEWREMTPVETWGQYNKMRNILLDIKEGESQ